MNKSANKLEGQSRRKFMMNAAKSALGVSMVPMLGNDRVYGANGGGKAEHCIFLYMAGGMTHMDTFDPKPGTENGGKTAGIKTGVAGIEIAEFLPGLAERFKDIALVRSMQLLTADHRGASYRIHTAYSRKATIIHPTTGPWAQRLLGKKHKPTTRTPFLSYVDVESQLINPFATERMTVSTLMEGKQQQYN